MDSTITEPETPAEEEEAEEDIPALQAASSYIITVKFMNGDTEVTEGIADFYEFTKGVTKNESQQDTIDDQNEDIVLAVKADALKTAELKLTEDTPVAVKAGDSALDADKLTPDATAGTWTIANADTQINANLEITINVTDITYSVSAPDAGADNGVTWQIKDDTADAAYGNGPVTVSKKQKVTVQAALAAEKTAVNVTVSAAEDTEKTKLLEAEGTVEFTVPVENLTFDQDGAAKVGATVAPVSETEAPTVTVGFASDGKPVSDMGTDVVTFSAGVDSTQTPPTIANPAADIVFAVDAEKLKEKGYQLAETEAVTATVGGQALADGKLAYDKDADTYTIKNNETDGVIEAALVITVNVVSVAEAVPAAVTIKGTDLAVGTDFTAEYSVKAADAAEFGEYKSLGTTGVINDTNVGDTVRLKFTAQPDKDGKTRVIDTVEAGGKAVSSDPDEKGFIIYTHEVTEKSEDADAADPNEITITLKAANVITVTDPAKKTAKVTYSSTTDNATGKLAENTADGVWKIYSTSSDVVVTVEAAEHYQVSYIHNGEVPAEHNPETCEKCILDGEAGITVSTKANAIDVSAENADIVIGTEQIKLTYTLNVTDAPNGAVVSILESDKTTPVSAVDTDANKNKYELKAGDIYYVKVVGAENASLLDKLDTVKANGEASNLPYVGGDMFEFAADETVADVSRTVDVAFKAAKGHDITVVMNKVESAAQDAMAAITAEAYKTNAEGTLSTVTTAQDIKKNDDGVDLTYASVWEGEDFVFTLAAKDPAYVVTKAEASTDSEKTWNAITPVEGKYTLADVAADTVIRVTTALDEEKAYSITFKDADGSVKSVAADFAGGSTYVAQELDKKLLFKAPGEKKVTFTVTPQAGYTVKEVTSGDPAVDVPKSGTDPVVYTYTFEGENKTAEITINTEAAEITKDKYISLHADDEFVDVKIEALEGQTGVTLVEGEDDWSKVYKLAAPVAADPDKGTAAVPGASELKFKVTVPYGYYLDTLTYWANGDEYGTINENMVPTAKRVQEGDNWVYTYKIAASLGADTQEAAANNPIHAAAGEETITFTAAHESADVAYEIRNSYDDSEDTLSADESVTALPGDTIILTLENGQTLKVDGEEKDLDELHKFSMVADLKEDAEENESEYIIDVQNGEAYEAYQVKYAVASTAPENYRNIVGEDGIEVSSLGQKVYVQLTEKGTEDAAEISAIELSAENSTKKDVPDKTNEKEITVNDAELTVTLKTKVQKQVGNFFQEVEITAATFTITAKDATASTYKLTAAGIKNNATLTLDAASQMSYALTLKNGSTTLDFSEYKDAIGVTYGDPAADPAKVRVSITDGKLIINALAVVEEPIAVTVFAKGKSADDNKDLLTFKVKTKEPALKVKSVASPNQGVYEMLVDVTGDGSVKPVASDYDLFYEVTVQEGEASGKKYYLPAKFDAKSKLLPASQIYQVRADSASDTAEKSYTFTAKLVVVAKGAITDMGNAQTGTASTFAGTPLFASKDGNVKTGTFKTRPAKYENKLGVTKKTTKFYSGQDDVVVAIPKFSKNAGYINDIHAVVYNKDGSLADGVEAQEVDTKTMEVRVDSEYDSAGSYDVVIYATASKDAAANEGLGAYDMYRASAKVPITVQRSINDIEAEYPSQIYQDGKKDVSVTVKATGWYGSVNGKETKAQTQKFIYAPDSSNFTSNPKNADKVVVKNNKITIKKNFIVSNDPAMNEINVTIDPNDFEGNYANVNNSGDNVITITVSNKAQEFGAIKLYSNEGVALSPSTPIPLNKLDGGYVLLTDKKTGKVIDWEKYPGLVTLTPNKGKIAVDKNGDIAVTGFAKTLTIKAVAKDGKKGTIQQKYTIEYPKGIKYTLADVSMGYEVAANVVGNTYTYKGRGDDTIRFQIKAGEVDANTKEYSYSVKVTGGKNTSSKDSVASGSYSITPSKDTVTVAITDKTNSDKKTNTVTYTFKDLGWASRTAKAPKASTKDKLFAVKNAGGSSHSPVVQSMTYTVNTGYSYVKLNYVSGTSINGFTGTYPIADNSFTVDNLRPYSAGSAKYSAVYGDMVDSDNGEVFVPKTKAAAISVKVTKVNTLKAVNSYTINPNVAPYVKLEAKPATVEGAVQYNKVLSDITKDGVRNEFYDYYYVEDGLLKIKNKNTAANVAVTTATLDELETLGKLTGYLEYQYISSTSGKVVTKTDKITVKVDRKAKAPKYTADAVSISGKETGAVMVSTTIKLGGARVPLAAVYADSTDWTASFGEAAVAEENKANGVVVLTATTPAAKKHTVNLYIVPADSEQKAATTPEAIIAVNAKVPVVITVAAFDNAGAKIKIAKGSKTPVAELDPANKRVLLNVELREGRDFTYSLSGETVVANGVKVPDKANFSKPADQSIIDAMLAPAITKGVGGERDVITLVLDRNKLEGESLAGNKTYNVPVELTFDSGAKLNYSFSIKTEKILSMDDVKKLITDTKFAVSQAAFDGDGNKAAQEVKSAIDDLMNPVHGITAAVAKDAGFAGTGAGDGATPANHTVNVTLTDITKATDASGEPFAVVVSAKEAVPTLKSEITAAVNKYKVTDKDYLNIEVGEKTEEQLAEEYTPILQKELQDAVDKAEPNTWFVTVSNLTITIGDVEIPDTPAARATQKKVTGMTFDYTLRDAMTGVSNEYYVDAFGEIEAPEDEEEPDTPPTPPVEQKVEITFTKAQTGIQSAKYAFAETEAPAEDNDWTNLEAGKIEVTKDNSNMKLFVKVTAEAEYTAVVKLDNVAKDGTESSGSMIYDLGKIAKSCAVAIEATKDGEETTKHNVTFTLPDENTGVANVKYAVADATPEASAITTALPNTKTVEVEEGKNLYLLVEPAEGYDVTVTKGEGQGTEVTPDQTSKIYTIDAINADTKITIAAELKTYTVTIEGTDYTVKYGTGTEKPDQIDSEPTGNAIEVTHGDNLYLVITANDSSDFTVSVDGTAIEKDSEADCYIIESASITDDITVTIAKKTDTEG